MEGMRNAQSSARALWRGCTEAGGARAADGPSHERQAVGRAGGAHTSAARRRETRVARTGQLTACDAAALPLEALGRHGDVDIYTQDCCQQAQPILTSLPHHTERSTSAATGLGCTHCRIVTPQSRHRMKTPCRHVMVFRAGCNVTFSEFRSCPPVETGGRLSSQPVIGQAANANGGVRRVNAAAPEAVDRKLAKN